MSDETQQQTEKPVEPAVDESVPSPEIDWKAQSRKWEARAKENRDAAKANEAAARELEEIKLAQLTELEKAQKEAQTALERAAAAEAERDRMAVIAKYRIPEEYQFLVDSGDLKAKAEAVQKMIREEQVKADSKPLASAYLPLPRSMSEVTVDDQLKDQAAKGDSRAQMRLKLMQLNSK